MLTRDRTQFLVVHCAATPPDMDIGVEEIRRWHIDDNGWEDVGYHIVIRRSGAVETGRDLDAVGAHVRGVNSISVGVCLIGGVDDDGKPADNFTAAQRVTLDAVLRMLAKAYPGAVVRGHRDFAEKACPSFDAKEWAASRGLPT
jgi:N-acetyl-anhydromuramyl-L-alanine amidase AmpD